MPLNIKDKRTHEMAHELASATGESLTEAVRVAVQERLARVKARGRAARSLADRLNQIGVRCARQRVRRRRSEDEILGYDERGMPR